MAKNRWISDLHWVRTGQQTRSQKTQALLLDAAATLFAEQGVDATAVVDVARRAGCSVG
ncbi:MAG: AcrR family transcriptional regulator, partial [Candidatus Azotimanducaceae bacterium]